MVSFYKRSKKIFKNFNLCLCSNSETKNFLKSLDVSNVFYEGNLKLIVNIYENEINNVNENLLLKKILVCCKYS